MFWIWEQELEYTTSSCGQGKGEKLDGLEIQPDMVDMARRSVQS